MLCRQHQTPTSNDTIVGIGQNRQHEAETLQAVRQLSNLPQRMLAGFASQALAGFDRNQFRCQVTGEGEAIPTSDVPIHGCP